jgi:hypothetical protein
LESGCGAGTPEILPGTTTSLLTAPHLEKVDTEVMFVGKNFEYSNRF